MRSIYLLIIALLLVGCATQTPPMEEVEAAVSQERQRAAQEAAQEAREPIKPTLKRKIAVGRISNETNYGRSLLRKDSPNEKAEKVTDMFLQALTNTGQYMVFERPDVQMLQDEAKLTGQEINITGVDTLVVGSLTQFGRATTGERGFLSSTKKQEATATVDLRLVDVKTGRVFASVTGTGTSSTEEGRTMGFGSAAGYDGSLNDQAIGAAVDAAVDKITRLILEKTWSADVLAVDNGLIYTSAGKAQGISAGMVFDVLTKGRRVKSGVTGGTITLPGEKIGELRVTGTFGEDLIDQGSYGKLTAGSIQGQDVSKLQIKEQRK